MTKVFLTGATGFVGGELLRRLARAGRAVVCLVRAGSPLEARERGRTTERALGIGEGARVEWVAGDMERDGLGLAPSLVERLTGEVDEVIHCAASTRFDLPLDEAIATNVEGARRVGELAARIHREGGGLRRVLHVSTAYASGRVRGSVQAGHLPPDDPALFRNTYERTKAMSERVMREHAARAGFPLTVVRPSIVVGDSQSGWTSNWNVLYFPMRLVAWRKTPFLSCGRSALLDCVPVDYVADATLALLRRPDTVGGTYHLTAGEEATDVREVFRLTCAEMRRREGPRAPIKTRLLGPLLWALVGTLLRLFGSARLKKGLAGLAAYVEYTCVATRFDTRREAALLAAEGVVLPPKAEFLPRVVAYALEENFGRAPRRAVRVSRRSSRLASALQSATGTIADALQSGVGAAPGTVSA